MIDLAFLNLILPTIARGAVNTLTLTLAVFAIATSVGFLLALASFFGPGWLRATLRVASWIGRGLPPLIILLAVFLLVPELGFSITTFTAAVIGMTLYISFYFSEAFSSGLQSIPDGQFKAAAALALPPSRILGRVILPQMLPAALPSYFSRGTEIVKGTAIAAVVAYPEMATLSKQIIATTFRPIETMAVISIIYVLMNGTLLLAQWHFENRQSWQH